MMRANRGHEGRLVRLVVTPLVVLAAGSVQAVDTAITRDGVSIRGTLVIVSPDGIEIEDRSGVKKVNIVDLQELSLDGEPKSLRDARALLRRRDPRGALEELAKIEAAELKGIDPRIREEYEFIKLASTIGSASPAEAAGLAKPLEDFLRKNSRSHHFYAGSELLGDLLARQKNFAQAAEAYLSLDRGPPALRIRSAAARAGLLQQQGKFADAIKDFEAAEKIDTDPKDTAGARQKREATLGRARCLAQTGKAAEGIAVAKQAIREAGLKNGAVQDKDFLAAAFTALGACQRAAGGMEDDARISFLTVDLVYNQVPAAHAESLANLIELWKAVNQPERARDAAQALGTNYPNSPWAVKLAGAEKAS